MTKELASIAKSEGLQETKAKDLEVQFVGFLNKAKEWEEKAKGLVVTSVDEVDKMKMAREARLALKNIRVDADKKRKELKEDSIRYGKAVQGMYNVIEYLIKPIEKHLEDQEKFIEREEQRIKNEVKQKRELELEPFSEFVPYITNLGDLSDEDYNKLLVGAKFQFEEKQKKAREEEEKRAREQALDNIERQRKDVSMKFYNFFPSDFDFRNSTNEEFEKRLSQAKESHSKEQAEQERIRIENQKLKDEQEALRKKAELEEKKKQDEIEKQRKIAEQERIEKERIEAELKRKKEEEDAQIKAAEDEKIRLQEEELKKGDSDRFADLLNDLENIKKKYTGVFKSKTNKKKFSDTCQLIDKVIAHIS